MFDIPMVYPLDSAEALTFKPRKGYGCIYCYEVQGKLYVGQTRVRLGKRHYMHMRPESHCPVDCLLRTHEYKIGIIAVGKSSHLNPLEAEWIARLDTVYPKGWNFTTGGDFTEMCAEAIEKIASARRGMKFSDEWRANISKSKKGVKLSPINRKKAIATLKKGRPKVCQKWTPERKEAHKEYYRNHPVSQETREKQRQAKLGKPSKMKKPILKISLDGRVCGWYASAVDIIEEGQCKAMGRYIIRQSKANKPYKGFYWVEASTYCI